MATPSATIAGTTYNFAGTAPGSTVSIGNTGSERTMTNLAAGRISSTSTDAVNGSQLFAANAAITDVDTRVDTLGATAASNFGGGSTYDATTGALSPPTYNVNGTNYNNVGSALDAIVNGGGGIKYFRANSALADSTASGTNSVAVGPVASATGISAMAAGHAAAATANDALALGHNASAAQVGAVALGSGSVSAAAVGTANTSINGTTYAFAGTTPTSTVSVGAVGSERTVTNVAAGRLSGSSTDAINGSQLFSTNQAVTALDGRVDNLGASTANNLGGGAVYDPATGSVSAPAYNVNGSSYNNVGDAINAITSGGGGIKYFRANSILADASAAGTNSVAAGPLTNAAGASAVAVGHDADAFSSDSVAIGRAAVAGVVGGTSGETAVGTTASATANQSSAFGFGSQATGVGALAAGATAAASGTGSVALGQGAAAAQDGAVALGAGSVTAAAVGTASGTIAGTTYNYAGTAPASTVSVGNVGAERTITNVAAGRVSTTSTDAINGSQLAATNQAVTDLDTRTDALGSSTATNLGGGSTYDPATGTVSAPTYQVGGNTYNNVGDALDGTNDRIDSINNGAGIKYFHANSTLADSLAAGIDSVAIGPTAVVDAVDGVAIGHGASVGQVGAVALGAGSVTAAAVGTASGTIAGTTYNYAGTAPASTVSVGNVGAERTITNVAAGRVSTTSTDAINGSQLAATNQAVTDLDTRTDALGSSTATNLGGGSTYDPVTGTVSAPTYQVGGNTYNNVGDALDGTNDRIDSINNGAGIKYFHANSTLADSLAAGIDSVAIGPTAVVDAVDGVAIGHGASVGQVGAVALGAGSVTAAAVGTASGTIAGTTYNYAGTTPASTVSVGNVGAERTITNVAAGRVSTTSTDAINGSQLAATNQAVTDLDTRTDALGSSTASNLGGGSTYDPVTGTVSAPTYQVGGNTYNNVGDALDGTNDRIDSINNGAGIKYFHANSTLADSTAIGTDSVAAGPVANAEGTSAVAVGLNTNAYSNDSVAIGRGAVAGVQGGNSGETAVGATAQATADNAVAVGFGATGSAIGALAAGAGSVASAAGAVALGEGATAAQDAAVALGAGSITAAAVGTASGTIAGTTYNYAGTTPASTVSVGDAGAERTITNVAAGRVSTTSTDAINGSQLAATNQAVTDLDTRTDALGGSTAANLGGGSTYDPATGTVSAPTYQVGGNTYNNVGDAITQLASGGAGTKYFHANSTLADSTPTGTDSIAVGPVANASATGAVAIGLNAVSDQAGAVALGSGSVTAAAIGTSSAVIAGTTYNFAGTAPTSTVSVGAVGAERTITNVAAGRLDATSTDAVNGSQLFSTNQAVDALDGRVDNVGNSVASNLGGGASYDPTTGTVSAPVYNIGGNTYNSVGDAITNIDGRTTQNSTAITNLSTQIGNGTIGLVQQDAATRDITVAQATDGTRVNFAGTAGDRVLAGVAAGAVTSTSTEAINGSQLFQTNQNVLNLADTVNTINNGAGIKYFHANSAAPDSSAIGSESVAIGPSATATMTGSVAVGQGALAAHVNSVALGAGSQTTVGAQPNYQGAYVGSSNSSGEVNVGGRTLTGLAAGAAPTDAVNVSQLQAGIGSANAYTDARLSQIGSGVDSLFQVNAVQRAAPTPTGANSVAGGSAALAGGNESVAIGNRTLSAADSSVALGNGAQALMEGSVAIGAGSVASQANSVSIGSAGNERTITHVAAGANDTDAVNVAQLRAVQAGSLHYDSNADGSPNPNSVTLNPGGTPTTVHNVGPGVAPTDAVNLGQLQQVASGLEDDIWQNRREARGGTASAMAMAGMPQATGAGRRMMAMGVGGFRGEVGMAVGVSGVSDNGRYLYKAQISGNTTSDFGFAVGAGVQW